MSWRTKQSQVVDFLNSLELFGMENQFPLRVLDSIRELKADVETVSDELSLEQMLLQIDPLLKHMGKKYPDLAKAEIIPANGMVDTVSMEDVAERIKEIIDSCLTENRQKCQIYAAEQGTAVLELERTLKELQHTQSHYEDIKNVGRFQSFCSQAETNYNTRVARSLSTYADVLWQNCDAAIARIKSILTKLKDERVHVSEREFWTAFGSKTDLIKQRIQSIAVKRTKEQDAVNRWATALIPKLNQSRNKLSRNRLIGIAVPLILVIAIMLILNLGGEEEGTSINVGLSDGKIAIEGVSDVLSEAVSGAVSDSVSKVTGSIAMVALPILYCVVYIPLLINITKKGFCNEVAGYLAPDMEKFLQETDFHSSLEEHYERVNTEAEQACQEILSDILSRTEITEVMQVRSESEEFMALCRQWETIYKMA